MTRKRGLAEAPNADDLRGMITAGKTIDWICEKWNVTPQTVRAWFVKFNLSFPKKRNVKTSYQRKTQNVEGKSCPVCQEKSNVNYILAEKHWFCLECCTEFDQDDVMYIYNDAGDLIEVIGKTESLWDKLNLGKKRKNLIFTVQV